VLHNDLKKDAINEFGIKYWTSNPVWVIFQEHGSFFYMNIEEKLWLLVRKILTWKDWQGRLKLRFLTEIGRFHWNQGEKVTHFAWFGEPCQYTESDFYSVSSLKQQSCHSVTLYTHWDNQSLLLLLNSVCLAEKKHIPILVISFIRPRPEPTIYCNQCKQVNHYTIAAVLHTP
jgi:hypothetical protein